MGIYTHTRKRWGSGKVSWRYSHKGLVSGRLNSPYTIAEKICVGISPEAGVCVILRVVYGSKGVLRYSIVYDKLACTTLYVNIRSRVGFFLLLPERPIRKSVDGGRGGDGNPTALQSNPNTKIDVPSVNMKIITEENETHLRQGKRELISEAYAAMLSKRLEGLRRSWTSEMLYRSGKPDSRMKSWPLSFRFGC